MHTFAQKPKTTQQTRSANSTITSQSHFGQNREVSSILHAKRTIGNQAVLRLLHSKTKDLDASSATSTSTRFSHDFSRIPLHAKIRAEIQPKLTVNIPGDIYEQEADRVAEQVMRMPETRVQRLIEPDVDEVEPIKAKHVPGRSSEVTPRLASHIQSLRGGGQPLPASTRTFFETRFGDDFRQVRVHTDTQAVETARALNAHAYTVGRDVVFGAGKYAPETLQGKWLLGHELTHVVQQKGQSNSSQHIYRADRRQPLPLEGLFDKPPGNTPDIVKTRWQDLDDNDIEIAIKFNSRLYQFERSIGAIAALAGPGDVRVFNKDLILGIAKYQQRNGLRVDGQVGWNTMAHMTRRLIGRRADYTEISDAIWLVVDGLGLNVAKVKSIVYLPTQTTAVKMLSDCRSIRLGTSTLSNFSTFVSSLKHGTNLVKRGCRRFDLEPDTPITGPKEPEQPKSPEVKPDKEYFVMLALADRNTRAQMGWMALVLDKLTGPSAFDYSFIYRKPSGFRGGCNDDSFGVLYLNRIFDDVVKKALKLPKRRMYVWFASQMCMWGRFIHEAADELSKSHSGSLRLYRCPEYYRKLSKYLGASGDSNIYKIWEEAIKGSSSHCLK